MFSSRRIRIAALAVVTAVAVPAVSLVTTSSALAGGGDEPAYKGKVIAKSLTVRSHPTTAAKKVRTLRKGTVVGITCKVKAVPVDGNRLWYFLDNGGQVAARYVQNVGKAPQWCGGRWYDWGTAIKKPSVNLRHGPTNRSKLAGNVKYGKHVSIICKVNGPKVGGNPRWYQLDTGKWVAARYIENDIGTPRYCNK